MTDPMMKKWAEALVKFSAPVKPGDSVLITGGVQAEPLLRAVYAEVVAAGGYPVMVPTFTGIQASLLNDGSDEQLTWISPIERFTREVADVTIVILADSNTRALSGVDPARQAVFQGARRELFKTYMQRDADGTLVWTLTQYPTDAFAQDAEMSTEDFANFVYAACMLDQEDPVAAWKKQSDKQQILVDWLTGKKEVRLTGEGTDLTVDVTGRKWINADGTKNFPDGEVFTGPVESGTEGHVTFTMPAMHQGRAVEGIRLQFENGKVVDASATKNEVFLIHQLDIDEGARYLGEFAFGTHFGIQQFTGQILFDEKIGGTVHMAVGAGYPETGNSNESAVHWDMICDLRQGGRVEVDGEPFLVDGKLPPLGEIMPVETAPPDAFTWTPLDRPVAGTVVVPGSKSITNRALPIAALARGTSVLTGALFSDDTRYMAEALNQLGVRVESDETNNSFTVTGGNGTFPAATADLFIGNSGTSVRFLTAVLTLGHGGFRIDGIPRMRERPIQPLITALNDLGSSVRSEEETGCPPVLVSADGLPGGTVTVPGDQSSQYFSALLIAAPYARNGVEILVEGDLVSKPYMPMTADTMRAFGVEVVLDDVDWERFAVVPGQHYEARDYHIEPDASNASYFFAAAAVTGGRVRVDGLGKRSTQGDLNFVRVLEAMGANVTIADDYTEVIGPPHGALHGVDLDLNAISDTAQTLAAIAPFADGPTTFRGVEHARLKETDRVAALATELRKLGQQVEERPDGLTIVPQPIVPADIDTYDDHRMAMSFGVATLRAPGIRILDPGCTAKTFPDFFDRLTALAAG